MPEHSKLQKVRGIPAYMFNRLAVPIPTPRAIWPGVRQDFHREPQF